jgi:hypothetical protein
MTERRPGGEELSRGLACGLWAGLAAVVFIAVVVAVAVFGLGLGG